MYTKIAILFLAHAVLAIAENCDCSDANFDQSLKENNDIVEFLIKVSQTAATEEEKYPVVPPGVVTGSLECQCSEVFRRKRKIMPKEDNPITENRVTEAPEASKPEESSQEIPALLPSKRFTNRNCPVGYLRVGKTCIPANDMLY